MKDGKEFIYQIIGYELMDELASYFGGSKLLHHGDGEVYQTLKISKSMNASFTTWRDGGGPFYIVLSKGARALLELDLSMIVHQDDHFTWNLKQASNDNNNKFIEDWLGASTKFDADYSRQVAEVKKSIHSGVNTPRHGHIFIENVEWPELCERYCELMRRAIDAHAPADEAALAFKHASDDDGSKIPTNRTARRHQFQFRLNMMRLYDRKCAISGEDVVHVLEAAHIEDHANCGVNHAGNGLLLRSDLHRLFDAGKISIHPQSLEIGISSDLQNSTYRSLSGLKLRPRNDGTHPDEKYLEKKWNLAEKGNDFK